MFKWLHDYFYGPDIEEVEGLVCVFEVYRDAESEALIGNFAREGELAKAWEASGSYALPIVAEDLPTLFAMQALALEERSDLPL